MAFSLFEPGCRQGNLVMTNEVERTGIKRDQMADMRFWDVFTPIDMPKVGYTDESL